MPLALLRCHVMWLCSVPFACSRLVPGNCTGARGPLNKRPCDEPAIFVALPALCLVLPAAANMAKRTSQSTPRRVYMSSAPIWSATGGHACRPEPMALQLAHTEQRMCTAQANVKQLLVTSKSMEHEAAAAAAQTQPSTAAPTPPGPQASLEQQQQQQGPLPFLMPSKPDTEETLAQMQGLVDQMRDVLVAANLPTDRVLCAPPPTAMLRL